MDDHFELAIDEKYDRLCGEILLTTKGNITLHCSMCELVYKSIESFIGHLYSQHLDILERKDIDSDPYESPAEENTADELSYKIETLSDEDVTQNSCEENVQKRCSNVLEEASLPIGFLSINCESKRDCQEENNATSRAKKKNPEELPKDVRPLRTYTVRPTTSEEERKYKCPFCYSRAFTSMDNMRKHMKRHTDIKKYECPKCNNKFFTESELRYHMKLHLNVRNYLCSDCGKSYKTNSEFKLHIKRHNNQRDFKCQDCGKAYFNTFQLRRHSMVHTGERPFKCDLCEKTFLRARTLATHMKIHENKRSYVCNMCGAKFNTESALFSHRTCVHIKRQEDQREFKCEICGKAFYSLFKLKWHCKIHSGEKFACDLCPKTFLRERSLSKHRRIHEIE